LATTGLYLGVGSPGLPDRPRAARLAIPLDQLPASEVIARVEARLKEVPEDVRGWDLIAPIYLQRNRFRDAQTAFRNALQIGGETPQRQAGLASALVAEARGAVTDEAFALFQTASAAAPALIRPRFWLAAGLEQRQRPDAAIAMYQSILSLKPADARLVNAVQARLAELTPQQERRKAADAAKDAQPKDEPGPDAAQIADAGKMTPAARREMIEGMVASLDARLRQNGKDLAGWQRLIRSYIVLGRTTDAQNALSRARKALADETADLAALNQMAAAAGLSQPDAVGEQQTQ